MRRLWLKAFESHDKDAFFSDAIKPASLLKANATPKGSEDTFWLIAEQIISQIDMIAQHALPTLCHLVML